MYKASVGRIGGCFNGEDFKALEFGHNVPEFLSEIIRVIFAFLCACKLDTERLDFGKFVRKRRNSFDEILFLRKSHREI